ncbi:MAG: hypothetical protein ISR58_06620 [Anaerolineales bacterium]|nr:Ig-like domain-containing protein [Chloroflexota bacterium]MBL6980847.1 hypothetical protein [Anaerolineales bacterium]
MKRVFSILLFLLLFVLPFSVVAQEETDSLVISLHRDFGYGAGGKIQGSFSLKVKSPDDLVRVEYLIDGEVVHTAIEPPFRYKFNTANFPVGEHSFSAIGYREDGSQIVSAEFARYFIDAEQAWESVGDFIVPLFVIVGGATLLGTLGTAFFSRKKKFKLGDYGLAGGVVCPRCQLPYARNFLAPNLVVGKLLRCPHCGKWAILPRASQVSLEAGEERYRVEGNSELDMPDQEQDYHKLLDDSRYER